ncbi:MAG: hypothetical protein ABSB83_01640 [Methanomassiliicoccales archaeon]|jgi:ACR3 family arsenite efflux pump ArsB
MVLYATYKNTVMAAALAVAFFGSEAAIPATICIALEIIWFLALTKVFYPESRSLRSPRPLRNPILDTWENIQDLR